MAKQLLSVVLLVLVLVVCTPQSAVWGNDFGVLEPGFRGSTQKSACNMVKDAGIGWCRKEVRWNKIVDDAGTFDWNKVDKQIKKILNREIKILLTLRSVHELFAPGSGEVDLGYKKRWKSAPPAPEYLDEYEDFVRQVVERYDGDGLSDASFITAEKSIKHWQVEKEPGWKPDESSHYWEGTAADYVNHYLVTYAAIKAADQEATVALSAFHHGAITYYIDHGNSFLLQVLSLLDQNGGDFDIFDYHLLGGDYKDFSEEYRAIESMLGTYQFSDKPIWMTEIAVNKNTIDPYYTTEEYNSFLAKEFVRRYIRAFGRGVKKVFWVKFADYKNATWNTPMEPEDFERFRGLTEDDLTPKPVYYTYKLLIEKKGGKKVRRERALESHPDTWVYSMGKKAANPVYVMWYDDGGGGSAEANISLPWNPVLVTRIITEPGVTEPETEVRTLNAGGELVITLDDSPIFVEEY